MMMMRDFAGMGYGTSTGLFALLDLLLLSGWKARFFGGYWMAAMLASTVWAAVTTWEAFYGDIDGGFVWGSEVIRNLLWAILLFRLLRSLASDSPVYTRTLRYVRLATLVLGLLLLLALADIAQLRGKLLVLQLQREFLLVGQLLFAVLGLVLVEQLFRNTPAQRRWGIKYLCFGLGLIYAYDFYLYTDALLFHRLDYDSWAARGVVDAMAVPLLAISVARNPDWSLPLSLSRRAVFHSTALFGAGSYMLLMALAGYYIRLYGGEWGGVLQISFLFGAGMLLVAMLFSGQLRARVKVFLNKHFFSYRYDYREEWLRLMNLLDGRQVALPLRDRVIWAISEIAESPGGLLWLGNEKGVYHCVSQFNVAIDDPPSFERDDPLLEYIASREWIIDLNDYRRGDDLYSELEVPPWLSRLDSLWLIVPLMQDSNLLGMVLLAQPRAPIALNWENRDLLKTAGHQAASYLALHQAAEALADARQFEGFNRLSAFVIHDLKNLIAQLSLVAKNAARHRHNPEFIDDAVRTIENSVEKMNRLMAQLKSADASGSANASEIDLAEELRALVTSRAQARPQPTLQLQVEQALVLAHEDRLGAVFGHILQNALDATPADGDVRVVLRVNGDHAIVEVRDNGTGMDADFVKFRLFRPFDSTKGLTGMGIGAYECREVVQACGGQVVVDSKPGKGTAFRIMLPLHVQG